MRKHTLYFDTEEARDFAEIWIYNAFAFALEDSYTNDIDDTLVYVFYTPSALDGREKQNIINAVKPDKYAFNES